MLQALEGNLAAQGVEIVLVSVDEPEDAPKALSFLRDQKVTLKSYLAERPLDVFKRDLNPRWPGMLPASFLYDSEGKLRYFWGGEAFENEIVPVIEGLLSGKPIDGEASFPLAPRQGGALSVVPRCGGAQRRRSLPRPRHGEVWETNSSSLPWNAPATL